LLISMKNVADFFKCRTHRAYNCEELDCKDIAQLRWMLARISACAEGVVNQQYKGALKGCYDMAQEALKRSGEIS